jgi:hypothetical protein
MALFLNAARTMRALAFVSLFFACGSDLGRLCDGRDGDTTTCGSGLACKAAQVEFAQTAEGKLYCDAFLVCSKSCKKDSDCAVVGGICGASDSCGSTHNLCTTRP